MNLLDKASIILTPSAYNNGEALCVKPSDGSGDFDFSRNSAATRVNAQGLVEDVQILSSNLIVNGDFATDTAWTKVNATISGGLGNLDATGGTSLLFQSILTDTKTYTATFTVSNYNGLGEASVIDTSGAALYTITSNGTFAFTFTHSNASGQFLFRARTNAIFSIDNVSVIEITDDTNLPRINYEGGCGSWLFEPQSTNLVTYSEDFSQWIAGGSTTIESGYLAPDGTNNAYKVSGAGSALTLPASLLTTTTRSIYARTTSGTGQANLCSFNSNTNNLFTITEQWQRFDVNSAIATGVTSFYAVDFRGETNLSEIILWGANATNDQDYATSYIPSNGTSVTRNQDVCNNGGSVSTINSTEGVLYFEGSTLVNGGGNRYISLSDNTTSNRRQLIFSGTTNRLQAQGTGLTNITYNSFVQTNNNKVAFSYSALGVKLYVNGVLVGSNTDDASLPANTLTTLDFALWNQTSAPFFGKTKALAVWKEALTDLELQELTTI